MLNERGFNILAALDEVAAELAVHPVQVALAWLNAQPGIVAPIASATNLDQLGEIMASAELSLSDSQLQCLNDSGKA